MSCNFIIVNGIICRTIFLLQNFIFIPLDIFENITHNKNISNRLEAWLTFFSADSPEKVIELIKQYPDFKAMYEHVYYICLNVERVMDMFSEELRILDRNTVDYMVDQIGRASCRERV